jgi:hypothetical protein
MCTALTYAVVVALAVSSARPTPTTACGRAKTPWVQVRFFGSPWPASFAGAVLEELEAMMKEEGIDACVEGPRVPAPLAVVDLFRRGAVIRVAVETALGAGEKRTEREVDPMLIRKDGLALAIAAAADELLRARWKEMEIAIETPAEPDRAGPDRDPRSAPLWPRESPPRSEVQVSHPAPPSSSAVEAEEPAPLPEPEGPPPAIAIDAGFTLERYGGGQTLFGPDVALHHVLEDRIGVDLVAGLREGRSTPASDGRISARAVTGGAAITYAAILERALALEVAGGLRAAYVMYSGVALAPAESRRVSNVALYFAVGASIRVAIVGALWSFASAGVGAPLRQFSASDGSAIITGVSSLEAHGSAGVGLGF